MAMSLPVSEWLDLMLEEIERKKKERAEAQEEASRRSDGDRASSDDAGDGNSAEIA